MGLVLRRYFGSHHCGVLTCCFDHTLSGWIGFAIMPTARVAVSATANLFTVPSWTMKEYTLSWTQHGQWIVSVTSRVTDNLMWLGFSLAP